MSRSGRCNGVDFGMHFRGDSSFDCSQRSRHDYMCDVHTWRYESYRKGCTVFLMCRLRSEEYQPTDFNKSPPDMGLSDISKGNIRTNAYPSWRICSVIVEV